MDTLKNQGNGVCTDWRFWSSDFIIWIIKAIPVYDIIMLLQCGNTVRNKETYFMPLVFGDFFIPFGV